MGTVCLDAVCNTISYSYTATFRPKHSVFKHYLWLGWVSLEVSESNLCMDIYYSCGTLSVCLSAYLHNTVIPFNLEQPNLVG